MLIVSGTPYLHSPVPREYVRLFPEALSRLQAPPQPPFSRPTRICSAISAGGGPGHSEPRRRRRGSRGGADGDRGGATGQARLRVTAASASALVATTKIRDPFACGKVGSASPGPQPSMVTACALGPLMWHSWKNRQPRAPMAYHVRE
uniref:Uncharacterized protein n=1 Tax=Myotis myotis TaxID=51298 RepID=A0A7J7XHT7_MYOMY|nr:hypothetical protein mMyoMyo1_011774 [Myotis myotis]